MGSYDPIINDTPAITDFYVPGTDKIELLQSILESHHQRTVSYEEAEEVAIQLISFFECLARSKTIIKDSRDDVQ